VQISRNGAPRLNILDVTPTTDIGAEATDTDQQQRNANVEYLDVTLVKI
jgi:hypothetical protein